MSRLRLQSLEKLHIRPSILMLLMALLLSIGLSSSLREQDNLPSLFSVSNLVPQAIATAIVRPPAWVNSNEGGDRAFGNALVKFQPGFTRQGGANVYGDHVRVLSDRQESSSIIRGSEFALGIWPANDQTVFEKPVEIRFTMDAARVAGRENSLEVRMYNHVTSKWESLPTRFDAGSYQIVVSVQEFKPVPRDFGEWGGRTFFGVFLKSQSPTTTLGTPAAVNAGGPTVNRNANLRAGPGTNYQIAGYARAGQSLTLVARTSDSQWYQLNTGQWIAAFLVNGAPQLPVSRTIPTPTPVRR
jgi:hypothetical protein